MNQVLQRQESKHRNRGSAGIVRDAPGAKPGGQKSLIASAEFPVAAYMVAHRIDIKRPDWLDQLDVIAHSPLLVRLTDGGVAAVFRYGAVVFFNTSAEERSELLHKIAPVAHGFGEHQAQEHATVRLSHEGEEGPSGRHLVLAASDKYRLQLVAETLAKAVMLSFQEASVAQDFDRVEPLAQDLAEDGKFSTKNADLLKAVGSMLLAGHRLNGRAEVMDKPDLLWDRPHLEGLYARLQGDYELRERAETLERKLSTLAHMSETFVETVRYHSSHRLEFAILLLIAVELAIGLYTHFGQAIASLVR